MKTFLLSLAAFAAASASLEAQTYTWTGIGNSTTGTSDGSGPWSTTTNWNPNRNPGTTNTAILPDVTGTTLRTITYDANAPATLGTLTINQATAGNTNRLDYIRGATVTNAITLGATAGTAEISVTPSSTSNTTIAATNGLTINANGLLLLGAGLVTGSTTTGVSGNFNGAITLNGGTLEVGAQVAGANSTTSFVNVGAFTMNSGTIQIDNASGTLGDRRLEFQQNITVNAGTITTGSAAGQFNMDGATNVLNLTTAVPAGLAFSLSGTAQTLTTNQALTNVLVRNTGIKTITRTGGSTTIGAISMIDASTGATGVTTFQLGTDLALIGTTTAQPIATNYSQAPDANGAVQFGIDTNGHTLNLATGATNGVYTPNASGQTGTSPVTTTVYTFSSTAAGGVIQANAFNLSTAGVTTNVSAGATLRAIGAGATATTLSGTGTIDPASIFQYAGTGTAASPATLTSTRNIGILQVTAGFLQVGPGGTTLTTGGAVTVTGGGLDISGTNYGALTLNAGNFSLANATLALTLGGNLDTVTAAGTGQSFSLSNVTIALNGTNSGTSYQVFNNFTGTNTVTNVTFTNVPAGQTASLSTTGLITFSATAVPEPGTLWAGVLVGGVALVAGYRRRHRA